MNKAVFKNSFGNHAGPPGNRHQHHELGLHIRRESRIRQCFDIDAGNFTPSLYPDASILDNYFGTAEPELVDHRLQVIWLATQKGDIASGQGGRDHKGAGFDAVGYDPDRYRMQRGNAFDGDDRSAGPFYIRAHLVQYISQCNDFGFARRIVQHGGPFGQYSRHHQIFGPGDGGNVQINFFSFESIRRSLHVAMF